MARLLESLERRDHPDPDHRDGIMSADSDRAGNGAEITTYDSLDPALRQARGSVYLGVKSWGAYVGLTDFFASRGRSAEAERAQAQAERVAVTLCAAVRPDGCLPALLGTEGETLVLPIVEGLIVPHQLGLREALDGDGSYGALVRALGHHLRQALDSGRCHFPDGGWRISSTSDNSWLSKIYLNQFIAEKVLEILDAEESRAADRAHAGWSLAESNAYWAWCDQIVNGKAIASKYYPRGVTSVLWLPVLSEEPTPPSLAKG